MDTPRVNSSAPPGQICRISTLDANHPGRVLAQLTDERRRDVCALLERHGVDPYEVRTLTYDVVDIPLLRIERYCLNAQGSAYLDPDTNQPAMQPVLEIALQGPLPEWWRPRVAPPEERA